MYEMARDAEATLVAARALGFVYDPDPLDMKKEQNRADEVWERISDSTKDAYSSVSWDPSGGPR